jgi:hypothetical protein
MISLVSLFSRHYRPGILLAITVLHHSRDPAAPFGGR